MNEQQKNMKNYTRRDFIKNVAIGSGTAFVFGNIGVLNVFATGSEENRSYSSIVVDYSKCTGCRICETVCSAFNHKKEVNGESILGLGNPFNSNIRVRAFNPDVDIPNICQMCPDNPCIESCPVPPDPKTGRKALYRDEKTFAIKTDPERCVACGVCVKECKTKRAGVIIPNPKTNKPERMCTLCDGDPQCVKNCPYGALSYVKVDTGREFFGMPPEQIAGELAKRWYHSK